MYERVYTVKSELVRFARNRMRTLIVCLHVSRASSSRLWCGDSRESRQRTGKTASLNTRVRMRQ